MKLAFALLLLLSLRLAAESHLPTPLPSSGGLPETFSKPNKPRGPLEYDQDGAAFVDRTIIGGFRAWASDADRLSTPIPWRTHGMAGIQSDDTGGYKLRVLGTNSSMTNWLTYPLGVGPVDYGILTANTYDIWSTSNHMSAGTDFQTVLSITNVTENSIIDIYNTPGDYFWTNRNNAAIMVDIDVMGGGGEGGKGGQFNSTNLVTQPKGPPPGSAYGGAGGGAGGWSKVRLLSTDIAGTNRYALTVGGGGSWAKDFRTYAYSTGRSNNGTAGASGTNSFIGNFTYAVGGTGGGGGTATNNTSGAGGWGNFTSGSPGGDSFGTVNSNRFGAGGGGMGGMHSNEVDAVTTYVWVNGSPGGAGATRMLVPFRGGDGGITPRDAFVSLAGNNLIWFYSGRDGTNVENSTYYGSYAYSFLPQRYSSIVPQGSGGGGGAGGGWQFNAGYGGFGGHGSSPSAGGGGGGGSFQESTLIEGNGSYGRAGPGGPGGIGRVVVKSYFGTVNHIR